MTAMELKIFMKKYSLNAIELSDLIGVTRMAVEHWLVGRRTIAKSYGRLIRLFDRHPELMRTFRDE